MLAAVVAAIVGHRADAAPATVVISRADCDRLTVHVPAPGVEYVPGTGVGGEPVLPADLNPVPAIRIPDNVYIPITVDLAARFGIPANSALFGADAYIGTARVSLRDGRAWFDGRPLSSDEQAALARLCSAATGTMSGR